MRRNDREIADQAVILEVLNRCHVGCLGTNGIDGYPRIKPVNFIYHDGAIFFHTALEGEKIDDLRRDNRVCFEIDLPIAYVTSGNKACSAGYLYRSAMIRGRASLIDDVTMKKRALDALMQKHENTGSAHQYSDASLAETGIVRIDIDEMTGKESLGKGKLREVAIEALRSGAPLPVVISADGFPLSREWQKRRSGSLRSWLPYEMWAADVLVCPIAPWRTNKGQTGRSAAHRVLVV